MTGHQALLQLRLRGQKPSDVFVMVLDTEPVKRGFMAADQSMAEIDIGPSDEPKLLDLRAIRGCRVHVSGPNEARVRAVANRARQFEPTEILAAGFPGGSILRWRPKA